MFQNLPKEMWGAIGTVVGAIVGAVSGYFMAVNKAKQEEKAKARVLLSLFDREAFKASIRSEGAGEMYRALMDTLISLQEGGSSVITISRIAELFDDVKNQLRTVLDGVKAQYPAIEVLAKQPAVILPQDEDRLKANMGVTNYYNAVQQMINVRHHIDPILKQIKELSA